MRLLLLSSIVVSATALQVGAALRSAPARRCAAPLLSAMPEPGSEPDGGDEYTVDWDTAWKKELSSREDGKSTWRPEGREPVSDDQLREARVRKSLDDAQFSLQTASTVRKRPAPPPTHTPPASLGTLTHLQINFKGCSRLSSASIASLAAVEQR